MGLPVENSVGLGAHPEDHPAMASVGSARGTDSQRWETFSVVSHANDTGAHIRSHRHGSGQWDLVSTFDGGDITSAVRTGLKQHSVLPE